MSFYEKYLMLCDKNKKTPSGAALEMGLSKTTVNRWKNGGGITDATILKVASYFGIPKEDLTGEEQKEKPAPGGSELDAAFNAVLDQLTEQELADVLQYAKFKVASRKENSNG